MDILQTITLAVLAGGASSRMGTPKAELRIGDQPILSHLLKNIGWPGPTLLITAPGREHPPGYEQYDLEAVDAVAGEGPLRGVLTALQHAISQTVIITPVDMPAVTREQLQWLVTAPAEIAFMRRKEIEPLPALFSKRAIGVIESRLATGRRSLHSLAEESIAKVIDVPPHWPDKVWTNLNFPDDFDRYSPKTT